MMRCIKKPGRAMRMESDVKRRPPASAEKSAKDNLFDHLVGTQQDRLGNLDTERFRSFHVYYQLELGWLFDREICRLCTPENSVYVGGCAAQQLWTVGAIGDEATDIDKIAGFVHRWKSLLSGELDDARSLTEGKGIDE